MPQVVYRVPFQIDHIIARQHGGLTVSENLALSCFHCNTHKGPNIASLDPLTGALVPLYHPRRDPWAAHFQWDGPLVVGLTPAGRATVRVLAMNDPLLVMVRQEMINQEMFPPDNNPGS
jgi:hypothetical protein